MGDDVMKTKVNNIVINLISGGAAMKTTARTALLTLMGLAMFAGCAQDVGTIDRVKENYVAKEDLLYNEDGTRKEWFVRLTVTETPYASAYSFIGAQDPVERGVFEIQEKYLYFYRTYTFVENEYAGNPREDTHTKLKNRDGSDYLLNGEPVWRDKNSPAIAYPIEKHFDIIWNYNPMTGEPGNVRSENASDRMWYERDYIRVNWGTNMLPTYLNKFQSDSAYETMLTDSSSPTNLDLNPASGYMSFKNTVIASVQTDYIDGFGEIPICWYYAWYVGGIYECVSEEIELYTGFMAVNVEREKEYHPIQYTDYDQQRFGFFRAERLRWDEDYGTAYHLFQRYATRHDIWKKDADGNIIGVRPLVYHVSDDFPNNLVSETKIIAEQWSKAFDDTVKGVTGKNVDELPAWTQNGEQMLDEDGAEVFVDHMFIVCENNRADADLRDSDEGVLETSEAICGSLDNVKENGDLRYSFIYSVNIPGGGTPYGYGPPSWDPISGRIISGTAYVYNTAFQEGAVRALDQIELLAGVKSFREIADAAYIEEVMRNERLRQYSYWRNGYTNEEAQKLVDSMVTPEVTEALTTTGVQKSDQSPVAGRMSILNSLPDVESLFVNRDVRWLFKDPSLFTREGQPDSSRFTGDETATTSIASKYLLRNWANAEGTREVLNRYRKMAASGIDRAEFYDGALMGLANSYKARYDQIICDALSTQSGMIYDFSKFNDSRKCTTADLIEQLRRAIVVANQASPYQYGEAVIITPLEMAVYDPKVAASQKAMKDILASIRPGFVDELHQLIYFGVAIHEIGHTVGLRHNFEASTDAMNFPRKYWDMKVRKVGNGFEPIGLFQETPEQVAGEMRSYQYSSVMDYYLKFNMPWQGLGLYDIAAIKYGYGNLVEVYSDKPDTSVYEDYINVDPAAGMPDNTPSFKDRGEGFGLALRRVHHTNWPNMFGDLDKMYERTDVPKKEIYGEKCETEGASCGEGKTCRKFYEGLLCSADYTVVPYRFASDELAWSLPTVNMWDEGVDPYEIVRNTQETYENYWVFRGYWHQDPTFWPTNYDNWVRTMFYIMKGQFQYWAVDFNVFNRNGYWETKFGTPWEKDLNGGLTGALATHLSFNVFAGTFGRPIPAAYSYNFLKDRYEPRDDVNASAYNPVNIFLLEENGARPLYATWNYDYYDPIVTASGTIYDRLAAFEMIADPTSFFVGVDDQSDIKKYYVNYGAVFRDEINKLFGGIMANNADNYGWCIIEHPISNQPIGFGPRDFTNPDGLAVGCASEYKACFTKATNGTADRLVSVHRAGITTENPCAADELFLDVNGLALEPEEQYVFPTTQFRIPMLAAYYGYSMLINNYDRSFIDATRIWLKGDSYQIGTPPEAEVVECEDRFTGKVYQAYRLPDGGYYPGYDLVNQCNNIYRCYDPDENDTLTEDEIAACKNIARTTKPITDLTIDDLRASYLFHQLQFLIGKLELIRAMYVTYEFAY